MLLVAGMLFAQQPVISFDKIEHDFGKINEADGRVTTVFEFKNEGMEPLVLTNVRASCGCTTPSWTKTPIEPGQTGSISVTYNPNGRPGRFQKTITVTSNATEATKKLYIKGEVIPKAAKPVNKYPVKIGALSFTGTSIDLGKVLMGDTHATGQLEYANTDSEEPVIVAVDCGKEPIYAEPNLTPVEKGKSGMILVAFNSKEANVYGPQEFNIHVLTAKDAKPSKENLITVTANVVEDFSKLTQEQLQNAPIMEVGKTLDLGVITVGKKVKVNIPVGNAGVNPLYIRRAYNNAPGTFQVVAPKGAIKSGKKGNVVIEFDGKQNGKAMAAGEYKRFLTIISNDPKVPTQQVLVSWTIK